MSHLITTTEERKEKLVDKLSTLYSLNQISIDEYERLIKYSQNIETDKELVILEKIIEEHNAPEIKSENKIRYESGFAESRFIRRSDNNIFTNNFLLLSTRKTTGEITTGNFMNILSTHKIIINEEDLIHNETELNFMVLLGSVDIRIPDNVNVIVKAIPVLGDISVADRIRNKGGRKSLIITGNVILGDIKIKVNK